MEKLNNQTIRHILGDIHKDIKELKEIAKLTNGRIKSLEKWKSYTQGALSVIILLLVPIVIQYISRVALAYFR